MSLTDYVNRRLLLRNVVQEFYSKDQPRDKKGQFATKGGGGDAGPGPTTGTTWSGGSAHPDKRVAPKSSLRFPIEKDDYEDTQGQANRRFARDIYDTDLGGGYRSSVSKVTVYDDKDMSVQGVITYKGKQVGTFDRAISIEKRGVVAVDHTELFIDSAHQGKGLADRFNAHSVAKYQEMGVDRVTVHAGDEVGGFAWARQGFRWDGYDAKTKGIHNALQKMQSSADYKAVVRPFKKEIEEELFAIRLANERGQDVQPGHLAAVGQNHKWETQDENGNKYMTWVGKEAMLGSTWNGVFYFDANTAVTAGAALLTNA